MWNINIIRTKKVLWHTLLCAEKTGERHSLPILRESWMGCRAGLDGWGKYRPHSISIPQTAQHVVNCYTDWAIAVHGGCAACVKIHSEKRFFQNTLKCICKIVGFGRSWIEFFRLLGHYAAWGGLKVMFWDYLTVPCLFSNMWPIGSPETSVSNWKCDQ